MYEGGVRPEKPRKLRRANLGRQHALRLACHGRKPDITDEKQERLPYDYRSRSEVNHAHDHRFHVHRDTRWERASALDCYGSIDFLTRQTLALLRHAWPDCGPWFVGDLRPTSHMRRFPPPRTVELLDAGYKVVDGSGQTLAYIYGHADQRDAAIAKALTLDEARRIASNIAGKKSGR
jgi:hypothetical protein